MGVIVAGVIIGFAVGFFINAGIVWVLCWALNAIGVHTLFGWTVQFSWPLVIIFTIICAIISGFFTKAKSK